MTKLDKRTLKRIFREKLESILNGKISHVEWETWDADSEYDGTVTQWADLVSFRLNGKKIETEEDNYCVSFDIGTKFYVDSIATIEENVIPQASRGYAQ